MLTDNDYKMDYKFYVNLYANKLLPKAAHLFFDCKLFGSLIFSDVNNFALRWAVVYNAFLLRQDFDAN